MILSSRTYPASLLDKSAFPAQDNPAVAHCAQVWKTIHNQLCAEGQTNVCSEFEAAQSVPPGPLTPTPLFLPAP